jgi:hypothetical protein
MIPYDAQGFTQPDLILTTHPLVDSASISWKRMNRSVIKDHMSPLSALITGTGQDSGIVNTQADVLTTSQMSSQSIW